jgi:hypothetical protein
MKEVNVIYNPWLKVIHMKEIPMVEVQMIDDEVNLVLKA